MYWVRCTNKFIPNKWNGLCPWETHSLGRELTWVSQQPWSNMRSAGEDMTGMGFLHVLWSGLSWSQTSRFICISVSERNMDVLQQSILLIQISYFSLTFWTPQTVYSEPPELALSALHPSFCGKVPPSLLFSFMFLNYNFRRCPLWQQDL